jgi:hypothetical protein
VIIDLDDDAFLAPPEPHPALVAAVRPAPRQVTEAAGVYGLLSDAEERWFMPAVAIWAPHLNHPYAPPWLSSDYELPVRVHLEGCAAT